MSASAGEAAGATTPEAPSPFSEDWRERIIIPAWLEPRSGCCRGTGRALAPPVPLPPMPLTLPSSPDATEVDTLEL
nr:unnamed protein product [Digitaria exilis]